jgi:hypothetical protein
MTPISANNRPLQACAIDGEVVLSCRGGVAVDAAFTPEAILDSIAALEKAAREALRQRQLGRDRPVLEVD